MRIYTLLPFILLFTNSLLARVELNGIVTYQNTGDLIEAIQVIAHGASPAITKTVTNKEGVFKLVFPNKEPGERIILSIINDNYDLINHERELRVTLTKNGKNNKLRLVVCKKGERDENAVKYYDISLDNLTESYKTEIEEKDKRIKEANQKLKEGLISQVELRKQLLEINHEKAQLEKQYQSVKEEARLLAEKFAEVDLAQVGEFYEKAFKLFKEGKIKAARKILEGEDFYKEIEKLKQDNKDLELKNAEAIATFQLKAQLAKLDFDFEGVERVYQEALDFKESNLEILTGYARFLSEQNNQEKAILFYQKALKEVENETEKAKLLSNLGIQYWRNNELTKSDSIFRLSLKIYQVLAKDTLQDNLDNLAQIQMQIGTVNKSKKEYEIADSFFLASLRIREELVKKNPRKYELALSLNYLNYGYLYSNWNELKKAKKYTLKAVEIRDRLTKIDSAKHEADLALSQMNLANISTRLNELTYADSILQEALIIKRRLAAANPYRFEPDVGLTLLNIAFLYNKQMKYAKAESTFLEAIEIYERLVKKNPKRFEEKLILAYNILAINYSNLNQLEKAKDIYLDLIESCEGLLLDNPIKYESIVANLYMNLGIIYRNLGDFTNSESSYLKSLEIFNLLVEKSPKVYKSDIASLYLNLGKLYTDTKDFEKADSVLHKSLSIVKLLAEKEPQSFNEKVCAVLIAKGKYQASALSGERKWKYREEGLQTVKEAQEVVQQLDKNLPATKQYLTYINKLETYFKDFTKEDLKIFKKTKAINSLQENQKLLTNPKEKVANQKEIVAILEKTLKKYPSNKKLIIRTSKAKGTLSQLYIFNQQFKEAELAANKGLELDKTQEWIITNLALSQLYQGKFKEAQNIFLKYKDLPYKKSTYKTIFLKNLGELEAAGIMHPDVINIRKILEEEEKISDLK